MNIDFEKGQTVILDLGSESFIGDIYAIDKNNTRIRLINVTDFQTKIKYNGILNFYHPNIKSITPLLDSNFQINSSNSSIPSSNENFDNKKCILNIRNIEVENEKEHFKNLFSKQELNLIDNSLNNIKVIQQNDAQYFSIIKELTNQENFILLMEKCDSGRHNISTVITIYAPYSKLIYIFDMIFLQKIHKEFKSLLEAERPKKIVFDSMVLCDHLKYVQNIEHVNGIFDVLVAFLVTNKKRLDLISCIQKYFALPENYFCNNVKYNWRNRPLPEDHKIYTGKKAIFLYKLYEYLLHEHLLKIFYQTCEKFSKTYSKNNDQVEVATLMITSDETADKLAQESNLELSFSLDQLNIT